MSSWDIARRPGRFLIAAPIAAAIGLSAAPARAGFPQLAVHWEVNGADQGTLVPSGVYNPAQGWWNYEGAALGGGVMLSFNLNGDPGQLVTGNLALENLTAETVEIVLEVIMPLDPALPGGTLLSGSAAIGLTADPGGGTLQAIDEQTPAWQALLDGSAVGPPAELLEDLFLQSSALGSQGASDSFGLGGDAAVLGPPAAESFGIRIAFSLTALDQASITSVFSVIPGAGTLAALAGGAVVLPRRRRRRARA